MTEIIHQHFIVDAKITNPVDDIGFLESWMKELVQIVGMEIAIPPKAFLVEDPNNWGPTALVGITTSHSSFHMWTKEDPPYFCFDLYSCKPFNEEVVLDHLEVFKPYDMNIQRIQRGI